MNGVLVVEIIKSCFAQAHPIAEIPLQKGDTFTAELKPDGIAVNNLGNHPFTLACLSRSNLRAHPHERAGATRQCHDQSTRR